MLDTHGDELLSVIGADAPARKSAEQIHAEAVPIVVGRAGREPPKIGAQFATRVDQLAARLEKKASPQLRKALASVRKDTRTLAGKTARQVIR